MLNPPGGCILIGPTILGIGAALVFLGAIVALVGWREGYKNRREFEARLRFGKEYKLGWEAAAEDKERLAQGKKPLGLPRSATRAERLGYKEGYK